MVCCFPHDIDYIQTNMMYRLGRIYYLLIYLRLGKFKNVLPKFYSLF